MSPNDRYVPIAFNPDLCAAAERLVRAIDNAKFSVAFDLRGIRVGLVRFDRQDRISLASLSVFFDYVLVDVNLFSHRSGYTRKKGDGLLQVPPNCAGVSPPAAPNFREMEPIIMCCVSLCGGPQTNPMVIICLSTMCKLTIKIATATSRGPLSSCCMSGHRHYIVIDYVSWSYHSPLYLINCIGIAINVYPFPSR